MHSSRKCKVTRLKTYMVYRPTFIDDSQQRAFMGVECDVSVSDGWCILDLIYIVCLTVRRLFD